MVTEELHALMQAAESVEEPGEVKPGMIVNRPKGEGDDVLPMAVGELQNAGYVVVYDIRDGRQAIVNRNMLADQLKKTDPKTGNRVFTTIDPGYRPVRGEFKCWLNPDHPDHEKWEQFGFRACALAHAPSEYEAERHVQKKHSNEYSSIKDLLDRLERQEDRALNRALMQRVLDAQGPQAQPEPVVESVQETSVTVSEIDAEDRQVTKTCGQCGEEITAAANAIGVAVGRHNKAHKDN